MSTTYTNPVYPHYFADPFVLKVGNEWWAYGTAPENEKGWHFPILRSRDLAKWEYVAHALPPATPYFHWAPEVAQHNGKFYLYYSASDVQTDDGHRLRVAVSDTPAGPFKDSGNLLIAESGFSIDAHPFRDPVSGKWFLYFAADYTDEEPFGTGLAVVALNDDLLSAKSPPKLVLRASCPWQIYERNRDYKGKVWNAWNCIEGPFVIYREGKYYCLYSGGNWQTQDYGVGFAVADHPLGPWRDDFAQHGPYVLKATTDVPGPGHASVTVGPDDQHLVLVYHAWNAERTMRRLCIDPLHWSPDGPRCDGPSTKPRTL
ncbi:MAG TPA: glycoside hydrolase family 43 protein [Tepidisphaeraceae bacterium]|jgi:beta-xylosidase